MSNNAQEQKLTLFLMTLPDHLQNIFYGSEYIPNATFNSITKDGKLNGDFPGATEDAVTLLSLAVCSGKNILATLNNQPTRSKEDLSQYHQAGVREKFEKDLTALETELKHRHDQGESCEIFSAWRNICFGEDYPLSPNGEHIRQHIESHL